jgi:hypothetical protein
MGWSQKPLWANPQCGFESHPLRSKKALITGLFNLLRGCCTTLSVHIFNKTPTWDPGLSSLYLGSALQGDQFEYTCRGTRPIPSGGASGPLRSIYIKPQISRITQIKQAGRIISDLFFKGFEHHQSISNYLGRMVKYWVFPNILYNF